MMDHKKCINAVFISYLLISSLAFVNGEDEGSGCGFWKIVGKKFLLQMYDIFTSEMTVYIIILHIILVFARL